jgi:DNA polymerase III delta prime subunit
MENININKILNREDKVHSIKDILTTFELNKHDLLVKKGIYIYGEPGSGKTTFITKILNELNYDIINYDAGDVRNKSVIDDITKNNMSDKNIMSLFNKKVKNIAIIMDEIDGMNNGDKGGINTLIKLIRPKKTKKQKQEEVTMNPIICIGNYRIDKKIKELMKVCTVIELKIPTPQQIITIINTILPNVNVSIKEKIVNYVQGDLRKLNNIYNIYKNKPELILNDMIENIFQLKSYNDDTKKITNKLFNNSYSMNEHINIMNETDRTSVGLLWHENIIDLIEKMNKKDSIPFYIEQLENICFADYIDRVTFQKQIWQFNEMSSLIKIFKNNKHFHKYFINKTKSKIPEIRFTKVLTKYSTEYNNYLFIQNLCQQLGMDKKDMFIFFMELKAHYDDSQVINLFENYEITKLDINRIYRYLEKYITENAFEIAEKEIETDCDIGFEMENEDI